MALDINDAATRHRLLHAIAAQERVEVVLAERRSTVPKSRRAEAALAAKAEQALDVREAAMRSLPAGELDLWDMWRRGTPEGRAALKAVLLDPPCHNQAINSSLTNDGESPCQHHTGGYGGPTNGGSND